MNVGIHASQKDRPESPSQSQCDRSQPSGSKTENSNINRSDQSMLWSAESMLLLMLLMLLIGLAPLQAPEGTCAAPCLIQVVFTKRAFQSCLE